MCSCLAKTCYLSEVVRERKDYPTGVVPPSSAFAQWQRRREEGERAQTPGKTFPLQGRAAEHHSPVLISLAQKAHRVLLKPHFFTQMC